LQYWAEKGCDDWRNGIPLCATHHDAFDNHLFCIEPGTSTILCKPGLLSADIGLREMRLRPLKNTPHTEALQWRWDATQKDWKRDTDSSD
jgi:putative restriction endonuclease